jgi:hypothetical protein
MYAKPLIYSLTAYECIRHHLRADNLNDRINSWIETNVPDNKGYKPCSGDMLCQREWNKRHKNGCIGKDQSFDCYAEALLNA